MSGKVPPSSAARSRVTAFSAARSADVRRAATLYKRFTGHEPGVITEVQLPPHPKAVAVIGELDAVAYTCVRDGITEHYQHEFARADRPLLCSHPNGRQLYIVDGAYDFTHLGIVDASDAKNSPRRRRR